MVFPDSAWGLPQDIQKQLLMNAEFGLNVQPERREIWLDCGRITG
jgi:hypothetical protein